METILRLLRLTDQDSSEPCRIITAVTIRADSAAADLLSSGDYAIAFPETSILYHGMRRQSTDLLTVETTSMLTNLLRLSNDAYAMELARKIEDRFSLRYVMTRDDFEGLRTQKSATDMTDLDCFIEIIEGKLSNDAKKVWQKARDRHGRYQDLFDSAMKTIKKLKRNIGAATAAQLEADSIKAIVDFELKRNKGVPSWNFRNEGIGRLADDFFLLNEYLSNYGSGRLRKWCTSFGKYLLSKGDVEEIDAVTDEEAQAEKLVEKVAPLLMPVSSFFVAMCHALQEGENELTAIDAYWLGLVDEVVGNDDLWTLRSFEEYKPDPPTNDNKGNKNTTSDGQTDAAGA
jgi:hypothetical protein